MGRGKWGFLCGLALGGHVRAWGPVRRTSDALTSGRELCCVLGERLWVTLPGTSRLNSSQTDIGLTGPPYCLQLAFVFLISNCFRAFVRRQSLYSASSKRQLVSWMHGMGNCIFLSFPCDAGALALPFWKPCNSSRGGGAGGSHSSTGSPLAGTPVGN